MTFKSIDASSIEINPLVLNKEGKFILLDAKISLDDNALFRHPDLEELAAFYRPSIDLNSIIEDAEETYFLESFDEALFKTLYKPKKELIKLVYDNMGGKRLTDKISDSIFDLINSISYEQAIEKIRRAEAKDSKSGVITTAKELKSLDIIKTIVAMTSKINNKEIDRIGYKDYKGQFKIIVDNMPSKETLAFQPKKEKLIF